MATLKRMDGEVLAMTDNADIDTEIEQSDAFKEKVYAARIEIDNCCKTTSKRSPSSTETMNTDSTHRRGHSARVKLPKLTIRPFDGDITSWTTFWTHLSQLFIATLS